jgi:hypothetical protein
VTTTFISDPARTATCAQDSCVAGAVRLGRGVSAFAGVFGLVLVLGLLFLGLGARQGGWMT